MCNGVYVRANTRSNRAFWIPLTHFVSGRVSLFINVRVRVTVSVRVSIRCNIIVTIKVRVVMVMVTRIFSHFYLGLTHLTNCLQTSSFASPLPTFISSQVQIYTDSGSFSLSFVPSTSILVTLFPHVLNPFP